MRNGLNELREDCIGTRVRRGCKGYKTIERVLKPWRLVAATPRTGDVGCLNQEYGVETGWLTF